MDIPIQVDLGRIAQDLQIRRVQVESVVQLLDEGNTVPFITRYRKERTGNLNEVVIHEIQLRVQRLRELAERKETILKAIEAQGKLTPDLTTAIRSADNPKRLEDLYLPFKPKKRTKASDARDRGLEPLAFRIWTRDDTLADLTAAAQELVNAEKGIDTVEKVLEGVGHILAEAISEMATVRDGIRKVVWKTGKVVTSKAELPEGQGLEYRDYFDYSEPAAQIPPHRILAINRGDKEGPLKVRIDVSRPDMESVLFSQLPLEGHPQSDLFRAAAIDALDRLILPSMEREVRRDLTEGAEKHAVEVFAKNLRGLLLQPPIPKQVVLAIDPGIPNGVQAGRARSQRFPDRPGRDLPSSPPESPVGSEGGSQRPCRQAPGRGGCDRQWHGVPRNRGACRRDHRRGNPIQQSRLCRARSPAGGGSHSRAAEAGPEAPTETTESPPSPWHPSPANRPRTIMSPPLRRPRMSLTWKRSRQPTLFRKTTRSIRMRRMVLPRPWMRHPSMIPIPPPIRIMLLRPRLRLRCCRRSRVDRPRPKSIFLPGRRRRR